MHCKRLITYAEKPPPAKLFHPNIIEAGKTRSAYSGIYTVIFSLNASGFRFD